MAEEFISIDSISDTQELFEFICSDILKMTWKDVVERYFQSFEGVWPGGDATLVHVAHLIQKSGIKFELKLSYDPEAPRQYLSVPDPSVGFSQKGVPNAMEQMKRDVTNPDLTHVIPAPNFAVSADPYVPSTDTENIPPPPAFLT